MNKILITLLFIFISNHSYCQLEEIDMWYGGGCSLNNEYYLLSKGALHRLDKSGKSTSLIKEMQGAHSIYLFGKKLYIFTFQSKIAQVWLSDGTESGTILLISIPSDSKIEKVYGNQNNLYFFIGTKELWYSDGSSDGTTRLINSQDDIVQYGDIFISGNSLYVYQVESEKLFECNNQSQALNLVRERCITGGVFSNGTNCYMIIKENNDRILYKVFGNAQLLKIKSLGPFSWAGYQNCFYSYNDDNFYFHDDRNQIWVTNGTEIGTYLLYNGEIDVDVFDANKEGVFFLSNIDEYRLNYSNKNSNKTTVIDKSFQQIDRRVMSNGKLYFSVYPNKIWVSDGTSDNTKLLYEFPEKLDIINYPILYEVQDIAAINGKLYFGVLEHGNYSYESSYQIWHNYLYDPESVIASTSQSVDPDFQVFPNPFTSHFSIQSKGNFSYELTDIRGISLIKGVGTDINNIEGNLKNGIYILKVEKGIEVQFTKVIKQ